MDLNGEKRVEAQLDNNLKTLFEELGRKYYSENVGKESVEGSYQELFKQINGIYDEKDKLEARVLAKQGKRRCGKCRATVVLESRFCNMCGEKLEELAVDIEPEKVEPVVRKCSSCGTILEDDAIFCSNCGKKNEL